MLLLPTKVAGIRWYGGSNTNTRARADGIGAGLKNTAIIIANQGPVDGSAFAATVCNEYSVTVDGVTYGDWYLPSKHELDLLYIERDTVGGFTTISTGVLRSTIAIFTRGTRISAVVISTSAIRPPQPIACVQFELFSYLIIYQFN